MKQFIKNNIREIKGIYREYNYGSKHIALFRAKGLRYKPLIYKLQQNVKN